MKNNQPNFTASNHRQRSYAVGEPSTPSPSTDAVPADENIWKACAGSLVRIPSVNSIAYYFPQGHVEQYSPSVEVSSLPAQISSQPPIPCRVEDVSFHAESDTDEVFAKIVLQPMTSSGSCNTSNNFVNVPQKKRLAGNEDENESEKADMVSFAKVLTRSDANNGGGFSVPRFCADLIMPALDFDDDPPAQVIKLTDIHGKDWEFRHIYRGTPRRHLLTTGWSKFVNSKKLVAGDAVVFICNKASKKMFVGVRRAVKQPPMVVNEGTSSSWGPPEGYTRRNSGGGGRRGRMTVEEVVAKVVDTVEKAVSGMKFEVVYYPRPGVPEFVVEAVRVEKASRVFWSQGIRVKMAIETEDSSRLQWFQGTVVNAVVPEASRSTWRVLEVNWDEQELPKNINMNKVNPWQVECNAPTPLIHTTFEPPKKIQYSTTSLTSDSEDEIPLPSVGIRLVMEQMSLTYLNHNSFPAGMQGARHNNQLHISDNINNDSTRPIQIHPEHSEVSIDLNSPDSSNSVQLFSTAGTSNASITSFQLFGATIQMEQQRNHTEEEEQGEGSVRYRPWWADATE